MVGLRRSGRRLGDLREGLGVGERREGPEAGHRGEASAGQGVGQVRGGVAWGGGRVQEKEELLEPSGGVAEGGEVRTEGGARGRARGGGTGEGRENTCSVPGLVAEPTSLLKIVFPVLLSQGFGQRAWLGEGGELVWTGRVAEGAWEGCCPALYSSGLKNLF